MSANQTRASQDDEIDLSAVFYQLLENKWLIIIITAVFLSIGGLYASRQIPQYQSSVLLQISDKQQGSAGLLGSVMPQQMRFGGDNSALTQIALINSRFIMTPVIRSLHLNISVTPYQNFLQSFLNPVRDTKVTVDKLLVPIDLINKKLILSFDEKKNYKLTDSAGNFLLEGSGSSTAYSSDKSIKLKLNTDSVTADSKYYLKKLSDYHVMSSLIRKLAIKDLGGKQNTGVLEVTLNDSRPKNVVQILNAIAQTTQSQDAKKKAQEASKTLTFLHQQLPLTKKSLEKAETSLNNYRASSGKIDIKLQSEALLQQLNEIDKQISLLRVNRIDMLQKYTPRHPMMQSLDNQNNQLLNEKTLLENKLKTLPASDQIAVGLIRDVEVKNNLYTILLNKIQELQVIKAGTISDVRILSFAKRPDAPLPAKKGLVYLSSMILGLMFSFLLILGRKLLYKKIDDPQWSERHFNIVNLAIVPFCKEQITNVTKFKNNQAQSIPLLAHINPRNLAIESLRSLRTSLQVSMTCASNNIVTILGISPGVGKSFVSSNLAYLLASAGKRVLLIDGDIRRGHLHKSFNLSPTPGLSELINKKVALDKVLMPVHENLTFLPRGTYPDDPSELLMSENFKDILNSLSKLFDIVVIDTAPVLLVTDAVLISAHSGTNYLVMGAKTHHPGDIEIVVKRLTNAAVPIHGSIFNFFNAQSNSHAYGKYNTYYYDDQKQ